MSKDSNKYRIAIPKGALLEDSKKLLSRANIHFEIQPRKLIFQTNQDNIEIILVRPTDVPVYVENGAANLGIVGSDVLGEKEPHVLNLASFPFGYCELAVAVPENSPIKNVSQIPDYCKVATKFPNLTRQFFRQLGLPIEIIDLYGSIEIAPLVGLSEAIVDLVGTGRTLKENGLIRIETISKHSARLIANRVSWQINQEWILNILSHINENIKKEA